MSHAGVEQLAGGAAELEAGCGSERGWDRGCGWSWEAAAVTQVAEGTVPVRFEDRACGIYWRLDLAREMVLRMIHGFWPEEGGARGQQGARLLA